MLDVVLIAISLVAGTASQPSTSDAVAPGRATVHLQNVRWLQGPPVSEFEKGRVYAIDFWSTWCAACVQSIEEQNALASRFRSDVTFVAVHIWQNESAPTPEEFLRDRAAAGKPIMEFAVVEDVDGTVARAWMDATENGGLPTSMIIDRTGRLAWFGHSKDIDRPLAEIVAGPFDLPQAVANMNTKILVGRLSRESGEAIEAGDYNRAIKLMVRALNADPETVAEWIPSTFGHLLHASRSARPARELAERLLATAHGRHAEMLLGSAHVIMSFAEPELRDLDLALTLVQRAQQAERRVDVRAVRMAAEILAEQGDTAGAMRVLEKALDAASDADQRAALAKELEAINTRAGQ